jgi:peptidoglycan biosynthesis protein MviN/MurJ (putative lipid II flippase)
MQTDHPRGITHTPWFFPAFCVFLGALTGSALWIGGDGRGAAYSFALFAVIAAVFAFGGRSETVRMIRGDGRDERWAIIDLAATAITGLVIIAAIIVACLYEWSQGRDGSPYSQLGAVGGLTYVVAILVLRRRR